MVKRILLSFMLLAALFVLPVFAQDDEPDGAPAPGITKGVVEKEPSAINFTGEMIASAVYREAPGIVIEVKGEDLIDREPTNLMERFPDKISQTNFLKLSKRKQ